MSKLKKKMVAVVSVLMIALIGIASVVVGGTGASASYDPSLDTVGPMWAVIDAGSLDTMHRVQLVDTTWAAADAGSLGVTESPSDD